MNLVYKSIIYRFFRLGILLIISYIITRDVKSAMSISTIDMIIATLYYYVFELCWNKKVSSKNRT